MPPFKINDRVLAIWPGLTGSEFGCYFYKGIIVSTDGNRNYRIRFSDGYKTIVDKRYVKEDGEEERVPPDLWRLYKNSCSKIPGAKFIKNELILKEPRGLRVIKPRLVIYYN